MQNDPSDDHAIQLERTTTPDANDIRLLGVGLTRSTSLAVDADPTKVEIAVWMRRQDQILGGAYGNAHYGWIYLDQLWVDESLRGQGWGTRLVGLFEEEGVALGCHGAWVETYSFQAPDFYERLGYREFGRLDDFPPGSARLFYRKPL